MKNSLFFFCLTAILFFTSSCKKEELNLSRSGSSSIEYNSALYNITSRLSPPNQISSFVVVENFNPYEDALADAVLKHQDSGFQELSITNLKFNSVGIRFTSLVNTDQLIKSCLLVATDRGSTDTKKYLLAKYDQDSSSLSANFTIDISPEEFISFTKENALNRYALVDYSFIFEFNTPPTEEELTYISYSINLAYDYSMLLNSEK